MRRRFVIARVVMIRLNKIYKDGGITKATKLKLAKAVIFPIATYVYETWTIKKANAKHVIAFKMIIYRNLRVP